MDFSGADEIVLVSFKIFIIHILMNFLWISGDHNQSIVMLIFDFWATFSGKMSAATTLAPGAP